MEQELVQKEKPAQIPEVEILNKEDRIYKSWGSVEVRDRENDLLPMSEFRRIMPVIMKRGGVLMDSHSNRQIGKILNYEFKEKQTPEGLVEGVYLTCQVFKDYELDDQVWEEIKNGERKGLSFGGRNKFTQKIKFEKGMGTADLLTGLEGFEFSSVGGMGNQEATTEEINYLAKSEVKKEDGETSQVLDHYHLYRIDESGNGETKGTLPREYPEHTHQIVDGVVQETQDHSHQLFRVLIEKQEIKKPFAGFKDFDDCVNQNPDKRDPKAFCAFLQNRVEKAEKEYMEEDNDKKKQTINSSTLPSSSEKGETFIKNKNSNIDMEEKKKIDEEQIAPEQAPSGGTTLDEIKNILMQLIESLRPVEKVEHDDEKKPEAKKPEEEEDKEKKKADVEKDINPTTSGEKVILPQTTDEKIQEEKPGEGAETDEVKFVEKVKEEVKKRVDSAVSDIKKELGLSKETTPRMGTDNLLNKNEVTNEPKTFKQANALARKLGV